MVQRTSPSRPFGPSSTKPQQSQKVATHHDSSTTSSPGGMPWWWWYCLGSSQGRSSANHHYHAERAFLPKTETSVTQKTDEEKVISLLWAQKFPKAAQEPSFQEKYWTYTRHELNTETSRVRLHLPSQTEESKIDALRRCQVQDDQPLETSVRACMDQAKLEETASIRVWWPDSKETDSLHLTTEIYAK